MQQASLRILRKCYPFTHKFSLFYYSPKYLKRLYTTNLSEEDDKLLRQMQRSIHNRKPLLAKELLAKYELAGKIPKIIHFQTLLSGYIKCNQLERARTVLENLESRNLTTDNLYSIIFNGYIKYGKIEEAVEFFKEMQKKGCKTNITHYNAVLRGLCSKNIDEAKRFFDDMRKNLTTPELQTNEESYTTMIRALADNDLTADALLLIHEYDTLKKPVSVNYLNAILHFYMRTQRFQEAEEVFEEFTTLRSIKPNIYTFHTLISGYQKANLHEPIMQLFHKMTEEHKIQPNQYTLNMMIRTISQLEGVEQAKEFIEDFREKYNVQLTKRNSAELIYNLIDEDKLEEALLIITSDLREGIKPNIRVMTKLIQGLSNARNVDAVHKLVELMHSKGYHFTPITYNIIVHALSKNGKMEEAMEVITEMKERGFKPTVQTYTPIAQQWIKLEEYENALEVFEMMEKDNIQHDEKSLNEKKFAEYKLKQLN